MKKFLFTVVVFLFLAGCSEDYEQAIIGFWKLKTVKTNQIVENKESYNAAMTQLIRTTSVQFNQDKSFGATIWGDTSFGFWNISGDSLFITNDKHKNKTGYKIIDITPKKLTIEEKSDSIVEILIFEK